MGRGIFYENFYHKILLMGGGGVGRGDLARDLGSNRGYFIKIGEIFLSLGLQLGERNFFELGLQLG